MSTTFQVREAEFYPVYTRPIVDKGYTVTVNGDLERAYFQALDTFLILLNDMEEAISEQINKQKYGK